MNYINDVPLYNEREGNVNLVIEICPGTSNKMELVTPSFERLVCVRQVEGEYPFYYGSFPKTYAGDKDPLDFILFTDIKHNPLDLVKADIIGAVRTIDAGEQDDKIICVESSCGLKNVKKQMKKAMKFLKSYKGVDADMTIEDKLVSMEGAEALVREAHDNWNKNRRVTSARASTTTSVTGTIIRNTHTNNRLKIIKR